MLDLKLASVAAKMPRPDFRNLDELFRDNWMFMVTSGVMPHLLLLMTRPLGLSVSLQRNLGKNKAPASSSVLSLGIRLLPSPFV